MNNGTIARLTFCFLTSVLSLRAICADIKEGSLISIEKRVTVLEQEQENVYYWNLPFFPLSELSCKTCIKGDLLFWMGDVFHQDYALFSNSPEIDNKRYFWNREAATSLGWRVGFNFAAPCQNDWEFSTTFTHWSDKNAMESKGKLVSTGILTLASSQSAESASFTSSKSLHFFDFGMCRAFYISPELILGMYTGVCYRALSLWEHVSFDLISSSKTEKASIHNGVDSFGTRLVLNMEWQWFSSWFLFSEFATNIYCWERLFAQTTISQPGYNYFWRSFNATTSQSLSAGVHLNWGSPERCGNCIDFFLGWEMQKHAGLGSYPTWISQDEKPYTHITQPATFFINGAFARMAVSF